MSAKQWRMRPAPPAGFARSLGMPPFHAHLLYNRGIRDRAEVDRYLTTDSRDLHDPMLLPDMGTAVERLGTALDDNETIGVFGDFGHRRRRRDGRPGTGLEGARRQGRSLPSRPR